MIELKRHAPGTKPMPKTLPTHHLRSTLRNRKGRRRKYRALHRTPQDAVRRDRGGLPKINARIKSFLAGETKVDSHVYPSLERVSGVQNWVDEVHGLPTAIERVAKHLHYERGYTISHAIAAAVNHCKKVCATGRTFGGTVKVNEKYRAECCAGVAEWEAKKVEAHAKSVVVSDIQLIRKLLGPNRLEGI